MRPGVVAGLAALALAACAFGWSPGQSGHASAAADALSLVPVISGLASPVHVTAPAGEPNTLYVVEQAGRIRVVVDGRLRAEPFIDLRGRVLSGGERGLLSLAFDPDYARNHLFYVYYTDLDGNIRVARFQSDGTRYVPGSGRVLLLVRHPGFANHNGGQLAFGPDGLLYAGLGDGGGGGDPDNNAQNLSNRLGKLLRLDVNVEGARWQTAAYGLRNPWRFSFDRTTGALVIGDVGQLAWEEIDYRTRAQLARLSNYGWSVFEGNHPYNTSRELNHPGLYVGPIAEYPHTDGNCAITGGFVYRGSQVTSAIGRYFYGDYCSGLVWSFALVGGTPTDLRLEPFVVKHLSSFGEDTAGGLYLVSRDGSIYRLDGS